MTAASPEARAPRVRLDGLSMMVVVGDLDRGGTERHLLGILPALRALGLAVSVYALTHRGVLAEDFEARGVRVEAPPFAGRLRRWPRWLRVPLMLPLSLSRLVWLFVRRRPRIAHCFLPHAYLAGGLCALAARVPVRVMSRRSLNTYQRRRYYLVRLEHWLHRRTHRLVGNSRAVVEQLLAEPGVDAARVALIYNGVDPGAYRGLPPRSALRRRYGVPDDAFVVLVVANLIRYKGHCDLLDALAAVRTQLPAGWRVLCVGRDDGIGAELARRADALGLAAHVTWTGARDDVAGLQCAADVGVLCSHEEGFSNAVLEGMAAGLPMVVTDVGGNAEAVVHGETGLVVPPREPAALAGALLRLAGNPSLRARMGEAGRERIARRFTIEHCVGEYARLYRSLASANDRGAR